MKSQHYVRNARATYKLRYVGSLVQLVEIGTGNVIRTGDREDVTSYAKRMELVIDGREGV